MLASKPSMNSQSNRPRFGNPDSAKSRRALSCRVDRGTVKLGRNFQTHDFE